MMKRTILFLLVFCMAMVAWADNITAQQALKQAQSFIQQREDAGSRPKRVKGTAASQMTMAKQVSGLYLFNIADNGGFVIVSNDDCTVPVLGFSDSGSIDPDNMPDNMRAWLQGYADEIAWAREHDVAKATKATKAGAAQASRRVGSHSTAAITPLVASKWNQDTPFNDLCPEYSSGKKSATGCVATAMAQVMYYHKWPQSACAQINSYTWRGNTMGPLEPTTFDWANMLDEYPFHWEKSGSVYVKVSDCTDVQATAVATLMKYCGYSVQMYYGPESGSNTDLVASALKAYFDYKTSTVQAVSRSYYSYANWTDLIYHELANGRPVVYGGQSSGGGHEFVCDGYKYESSMDFFHINWGWGGTSDNYFVLSALDPDEQGIGGSSSTDGFHYGQDAVIGIQPSTGTGTTADITPVVINLKANSITPSSNPATCYVPMNITVNVTNNSADDYDGDISIGLYDGGWYVVAGTNCFIPSGTTKDVVVPYLPTEAGNYTIMPFDGSSYSIGSSTTFTVSAAQKNTRVPIFGDNCDEYSKSQIIIPAANLEEMAYGTLNSVTFYASTLSAINWGTAKFDVYLKEVPETSFASATLYDWSTMEKVYSGSLSVGSDGRMVITFSNPFVYEGGNLLVGINQTQSGNYYGLYWVGSSASSASLGGYNTSIAKQDFLPLTTFDYTPGLDAKTKPANVAVTPSGTSAKVTWTNSSEYATGYNLRYRTAEQEAVVFEDDFESGLGKWTVYTEGEAGGSNGWFTTNPNNGLSFEAHSGSYAASAWSWNSSAYHADNWLVTPQVVMGSELRFWVRTHPSWPDSYEVLLSTTGPAIANFTVTLQAMAPAPSNSEWNEVVIDLSAYTGQQGYIAIHHVGYDNNYLLIDDFGIYGVGKAAGEWKNVSATTTNKVLTGLTQLTTYELQLQGVYSGGTSDWTVPVLFTTTDAAFVLGDANGDGEVTITDAVAIVNRILGNASGNFNEEAADVNGDHQITITDAVGVVNIILNNGGGSSAPKMEEPDSEAAEGGDPE